MEPEQQQNDQQSTKPIKGYGKRSAWQWILIYIIVAVVLYGIIYLVFIRKDGAPGY